MKKKIKIIVSLLCVIIVSISMAGAPFFEYNAIQAASKTKLKKSKVTLKEGATYQVKLKNKSKKGKYRYQTSNKKIAKVNKKGKVTAIKKGNAKITVKHAVGRKTTKIGTLKVTVKAKDAKKANIPTNSPTTEDKEPNVPVVPTNQDDHKQQTQRDLGEVYFKGDKFEVTLQVDSKWDEAYNATVTIRNIGDAVIDDWAVFFYSADKITNLWNGKVLKWEDGVYLVGNAVWNQDIPADGSVSFGFTAKYEDEITVPTSYALSNHRSVVDEEDYKVEFILYSDWADGFNAGMTITNLTDEVIEDWSLEFDFDREIDNIWSTVITEKTEGRYELKNPGWEQNVETDRPVIFGFTGYPGGITENPKNFILKKYGNDIDYDLDDDGDGLTDVTEVTLGTNPYLKDTDGDGLDDYIEAVYLNLDPLNPDTDGNGVMDGDEDTDEDGLTNLQEWKLETQCWNPDTDGDGLKDGEEINQYGTNPTNPDTDGDGLEDGNEISLGFDPLSKDSDKNGVLDCDEKVGQSLTVELMEEEKPEITSVTVDMAVNGDVEENTTIESVYGVDVQSSEVEGLVGVPVEITTEGQFDQAVITFHYDPTQLGETEEEDLAVMWYDEENEEYVLFEEESVLDPKRHTVSYTTTHFSTYLVVNKRVWKTVWKNSVEYRDKENYDILLCMDVATRMEGDKMKNSKKAAINMVDALGSKDRLGVLSYARSTWNIHNFSRSLKSLKAAINNMEAGGGTNSALGLPESVNRFKSGYTPQNNKTNKAIIMIGCGDVDYNSNAVNEAKTMGIVVHTILIENSTHQTNWRRIAHETGGSYLFAEDASQIVGKMRQLEVSMLGEIDTTDTDKDGLYDVYEKKGMLSVNGKIYYSSADKADTDGDGVSDFEEMTGQKKKANGEIPRKEKILRIKETGEEVHAYCFKVRSNPKKADTDNDGYRDNVDPRPNVKDVVEVKLKKDDYIPIQDGKNITYGGNQDWFRSLKLSKKHQATNLCKYGCGTISAGDLFLYWSKSKNTTNRYTKDCLKNNPIHKDNYLDYIVSIDNDYAHTKEILGVLGFPLADAVNKYCKDFSLPYKAKWSTQPKDKKRIESIVTMLKDNIPVIIGIGPPTRNLLGFKYPSGVKFYKKVAKPDGGYKYKIDIVNGNDLIMRDHYVTITGVVSDKIEGVVMLKISSWGEEYYIDYTDFAAYILKYGDPVSSNILVITKT